MIHNVISKYSFITLVYTRHCSKCSASITLFLVNNSVVLN